jgi:DnaJ-class molecular chaperone
MEYKDYYSILGLERGATQDEIKRAFRKLARKFHPDISKEPTAEARKEISEAYEVLGDAEKRAAYDRLGKEWRAGQEFRPPPEWDAGFEFSGADFERGAFSTLGKTRWRTSSPRSASPSELITRSPTWRCISRTAA